MADSFGTISFEVLAEKPGGARALDVAETHVPGGTVNIVDVGGLLAEHVDLTVHFASDGAYAAMRGTMEAGAAGTGALTYWGGTFPNVLLAGLERTWRNPEGHSFADAKFIVTA